MKLTGLRVRSRAAFGTYVGGLGALLGPMLAVLGRSWALCWRSWAALGPMLAVLGRSWALCWRSWAALGAYVGGLGPLLGPKLAVLGPKSSVLEAIRAKSGPNPSGNAIRHSDQGEKWPKPERERRHVAGAPRSPLKRRIQIYL